MRKIAKEYREHAASALVIEDAGSGAGLIQVVSENGIDTIGVKPKQDKVSWANLVTPLFEAWRVLFPDFLPFMDDLRNEMLAFPRGRNDDQVDSIVQALNWHQGSYPLSEHHLVRALLIRGVHTHTHTHGHPKPETLADASRPMEPGQASA